MRRAILDNWALFTGILTLIVANSLLATLLTIRSAELGLTAKVNGTMQSGYPARALLGTILAPFPITDVGHVPAFSALASACSISTMIHTLTNVPYSQTALRTLAGICFPSLYVITESWLNSKEKNRQRMQILSHYFIAQFGAQALAAVLIGPNVLLRSRIFLCAAAPLFAAIRPSRYDAPREPCQIQAVGNFGQTHTGYVASEPVREDGAR